MSDKLDKLYNDMGALAEMLHMMYTHLVRVGFSEVQAMQLVAEQLRNSK